MDRHICLAGLTIRHFLIVCLLLLFVEAFDGNVVYNTTINSQRAGRQQRDATDKPKFENYVSFETVEEYPKNYMRFCDTEAPIYDFDKICASIVGIVVHAPDKDEIGTGEIINSGIFVRDDHILTSYSPFRQLRKTVERTRIYINYLIGKAMLKDSETGYFINRTKISCARQVAAMKEDKILEDQWHGTKKTHTPLHDLMIMQIEKKVKFVKSTGKYTVKPEKMTKPVELNVLQVGPMSFDVAAKEDDFPDKFKIVSLGLMDHDHVYNKNHLHTSREYDTEDNMQEDCDEWFPRDWGHFLCIKNDDDFVGIGSGAILVDVNVGDKKSKTKESSLGQHKADNAKPITFKVFGVGSFMLKKGGASILVFTDVRPYSDAIKSPCTSA